MELNKENLQKCYLIKKLSTRECAKIFNVGQKVICTRMKWWEIKGRPHTENKMPTPKGSHLSESHKKAISEHHKNDPNWHTKGSCGKKHYNWQRVERKCSWCNSKIVRKKCYNIVKHTFCSPECHSKWLSKRNSGENSPCFTSILVKCSWCSNDLWRTPSLVKKHKHFFCNGKHCGLWKAENIRGNKVYNWKGGHDSYYGENWLAQRRKVLARDNYTCQNKKCGKTKEELGKNPDVHHKIPFSDFGLENYKEANELKNLISYCASCHSKISNCKRHDE